MYLRTAGTNEALGPHPSLLLVIGYAIAPLSPTGLFFGVLWSRTGSLALIVALHGVADLVPTSFRSRATSTWSDDAEDIGERWGIR